MRLFRSASTTAALIVAALLPAGATTADEGMWLFNKPPSKQLKNKYGFEPTSAWLEHLQRSCVRFGGGGSASIVSADGLVMTNHHVGHDAIEKLSTKDRNLLATGFHARTRAAELRCPDTEVQILWSIDDVTDRVNAAVKPDMPTADANTARRKQMTLIEAEQEKKTGLKAEIVTLYHGARYHLYTYKRYTDVRLVMAPEEQIAFFGGDTDNFEFPRFNLDVSFFRIYENNRPLTCEHFLPWSRSGAADGELTFVLGHPGRTQRLFTLDHLRFLRDVEVPSILRKLWRYEVILQTFAARSDENARMANGDRRSVENSRKAFSGILAGLHDHVLMKKKADDEARVRAAVDADPEHRRQWGDAWERLSKAHENYRTFYERYAALEGRRRVLRGDLLSIAQTVVRMAAEKSKPNADRLREYTDSELPSRELELYSTAPIYPALEVLRLQAGLSFLAEAFGYDDEFVRKALAGMSPRQRAMQLVGHASRLRDVAVRRELAAGGTAAIAASKDPLIRFVADVLDPEARRLRTRYEDEIESVERDCYAKIAAARFAQFGEDLYPDATFTLRLSFGPVRGCTDPDGRPIEPVTTFAGMYARMQQRGGTYPFNLPPRWTERRSKLDLDTPFNFICTADIIGGNSGSPVVNRAGEVVGLIFDGNIDSLVWDIAYDDRQGRAVAVDSRGIIEALRKIYDADALVNELLAPPPAN
ncbi:MAG: S46 family peptidase [Phycisphaerae bacterium]|nr:S46 family peptidase [Phycisphaerae bacterium]